MLHIKCFFFFFLVSTPTGGLRPPSQFPSIYIIGAKTWYFLVLISLLYLLLPSLGLLNQTNSPPPLKSTSLESPGFGSCFRSKFFSLNINNTPYRHYKYKRIFHHCWKNFVCVAFFHHFGGIFTLAWSRNFSFFILSYILNSDKDELNHNI